MIIYLLIASLFILIILSWLIIEYGFLLPTIKGLPILMYHKVSCGQEDGITISTDKLRKQLNFIRSQGYTSMGFREIEIAMKTGGKLPKRPLILTFDDGYRDFKENALPILSEYGFKASVFIPVGFMGQTNHWDRGSDPLLNVNEIKELANSENIEFGIHSYLHRNYAEIDAPAIKNDLELCFQTLNYHKIPFIKVLAYPYGGYPKHDLRLKAKMKEIFIGSQLLFALRIGNRINRWPIKDVYEVKRIDIKGTDNFYTFKTKLTKGRRKLFS
jgi:peptidoglycan/xylan/chitin deacetylase (PgdA/CDA1 family)